LLEYQYRKPYPMKLYLRPAKEFWLCPAGIRTLSSINAGKSSLIEEPSHDVKEMMYLLPGLLLRQILVPVLLILPMVVDPVLVPG